MPQLAGRSRGLAIAVAVAALSVLAWLLIVHRGGVGYDPAWSLVWGRQIAHGELPDLEASAVAPTPHPLANLLGALASLTGSHAPDVLLVLSAVFFALLALAAFDLGAAVSGPAAGLLLALLLVTRPLLASEAAQATIDIPFLALVLFATAAVVRDPRPRALVFVSLALAGLLRPEAWLLAGAYAAYLLPRTRRTTERLVLVLAALAAPIVWALCDLIATGDPFFSLHGTQDLATLLERPREAGSALHLMTPYLELILGDRIVWLGFAGAVAGAILLYKRVVVPSVVFWLGLAAFVGLGIAQLPVLIRYLLVPAALLALFAALTVTGWQHMSESGRARSLWQAGAVLAVIVLLAGVPTDVDHLQRLDAPLTAIESETDDLQALLDDSVVRAWNERCARLEVDGFRYAPLATYLLGRDPRTSYVGAPGGRRGPLTLTRVGSPSPIGYRRVAGNQGWTLYERCGALSASSA